MSFLREMLPFSKSRAIPKNRQRVFDCLLASADRSIFKCAPSPCFFYRLKVVTDSASTIVDRLENVTRQQSHSVSRHERARTATVDDETWWVIAGGDSASRGGLRGVRLS